MFPGTTSSEAPFLAPRRLPGPGAALLARPWEAWEAGRENRVGRSRDSGFCRDRHERHEVASGEERIRGGCMVVTQCLVESKRRESY